MTIKLGAPDGWTELDWMKQQVMEPVRLDLGIEVPIPISETVLIAVYQYNSFSFIEQRNESNQFSIMIPLPTGQAERLLSRHRPDLFEPHVELIVPPDMENTPKDERPKELMGYPIKWLTQEEAIQARLNMEPPEYGLHPIQVDYQPDVPIEELMVKPITQEIIVRLRFDEETTNEICLAYVITQFLDDDVRETVPEWENMDPDVDNSVLVLSNLLTWSIVTRHNDADSPLARSRAQQIEQSQMMTQHVQPGFFTDIKWQLFAYAVASALLKRQVEKKEGYYHLAAQAVTHISQLKQSVVDALLKYAEEVDNQVGPETVATIVPDEGEDQDDHSKEEPGEPSTLGE